jgi:hypothetical protein
MCEGEGTGLQDTYTDYNAKFSVTARDRYGNLRGVGGDNWTISITKSGLKIPRNFSQNKATEYPIIALIDHHNGTYFVTYKLSDSGNYQIEISLNDLQIQGSPFSVKCDWGTFIYLSS